MSKLKESLALQIFLALGLGVVAGLCFLWADLVAFPVKWLKPFGTIFINLLKFICVPIVLTSIIQGVVSLGDPKKIGSIGGKTILYYLCTTMFAITIGLILANLFTFPVLETSGAEYAAKPPVPIMDTIIKIFPTNILAPIVGMDMLPVIVIALFIGFGIILTGEKGKIVKDVNDGLVEVFMKIMHGIISLSPYAVFCLITPVVAENGPKVLGSLALVLLCAYIAYAVHVFVTYSTAVSILGKMNPLKFLKGGTEAFLFAFTSTSSAATIPISLECAEKNLGVRKDVASFTLPLGATINMDGTAIYQGVAAVFIASCYGIDLTLGDMITIILTATLASIGTAGTPGAGMIMLAMVLESVGLPVEGIALVFGVDRIFDMGRTGVNVLGDLSAAVIVDRSEKKREGLVD